MGFEQEAAVRAFMAEMEGEQLDSAQVERLIGRMASDARYQVIAWNEPLVGPRRVSAPSCSSKPHSYVTCVLRS